MSTHEWISMCRNKCAFEIIQLPFLPKPQWRHIFLVFHIQTHCILCWLISHIFQHFLWYLTVISHHMRNKCISIHVLIIDRAEWHHCIVVHLCSERCLIIRFICLVLNTYVLHIMKFSSSYLSLTSLLNIGVDCFVDWTFLHRPIVEFFLVCSKALSDFIVVSDFRSFVFIVIWRNEIENLMVR